MVTREASTRAVRESPPATLADRLLMGLILVPFCGFFIVAGGLIAGWTAKGIVEGALAAGWPQTTGTLLVMENELVSRGSEGSEDGHEVVVRYAYNVDGREYRGTRVHPAYSASGFNEGHDAVEARLAGKKQVRVYYHAENPAVSTLSVGFYTCTLAAFFGGLAFLSFGLGIVGIARAAAREDRAKAGMFARVLFVGTFLSMGLFFLFAWIGSQDFASGITILG